MLRRLSNLWYQRWYWIGFIVPVLHRTHYYEMNAQHQLARSVKARWWQWGNNIYHDTYDVQEMNPPAAA